MALLPDILPFRALKGLFGGIGHGFRGKMDVNEHFSDGKWENDPEKKSKAGRAASEWLGVRGGGEKGEKIGKWAGGIGAALFSANWLTAYITASVSVGALTGLFPIIAAGALVIGAAMAGAAAGEVLGRGFGRMAGGVFGPIIGGAVGLFNSIFKRGYYGKDKQLDAPAPTGAAPPDSGLPSPSGTGFDQPDIQQNPLADHPHEQKKGGLSGMFGGARSAASSGFGGIGRLAAIGGGIAGLAFARNKLTAHAQAKSAGQQDGEPEAADIPDVSAPPAVTYQPYEQQPDLARAMQQVDAERQKGEIRTESLPLDTPLPSRAEQQQAQTDQNQDAAPSR